MLRISRLADYGTIIMGYLAELATDKASTVQISSKTGINQPTVSKLVKKLTSAGLLSSTLGQRGGYQLAKPAQEISLGDIIQAVEGYPGLTDCSGLQSPCELKDSCSMADNWQVLSKAIFQSLNSIHLAAFATGRLSKEQINLDGFKMAQPSYQRAFGGSCG